MRETFVDSAARIALLNVDDALHQPARQVMRELRQRKERLLTSDFVMLEVADAFCRAPHRGRVIAFINGLRTTDGLRVMPLSSDLMVAGWELYCKRPDKDWSLTDCTSFVLMEQEQLTHAFTSDHHFEQAGFVKLL